MPPLKLVEKIHFFQKGVEHMVERTELRRIRVRAIRHSAANIAAHRSHPEHIVNGDEYNQPDFIAAYSKAPPHNAIGEVRPDVYRLLLRAVQSGDPDDWERMPLALSPPQRKLTNPQPGLAYDV